jgi:beta-lactamase regulating signal transducer with metallopeptidase domain
MNKTITTIAFALLSFVAIAQKATWKEMNDFHTVMAKTFHPSEEGNLQPVKDSASVLVAKATAWQKSKTPQGYDAKVAAPILEKLVAKCIIIQKAVAEKKSDEELKRLIAGAHEIFHEIMEKCVKDGDMHSIIFAVPKNIQEPA